MSNGWVHWERFKCPDSAGPWLSVHVQLVFISCYVGLWHLSCADTRAQQWFLQHVIVPACPVCPVCSVWLVYIKGTLWQYGIPTNEFQDSDSKSWANTCRMCWGSSWWTRRWQFSKLARSRRRVLKWKFNIQTSTYYHCQSFTSFAGIAMYFVAKIVDAWGRRLWRCGRGRCWTGRTGHAQAADIQHVAGLQKKLGIESCIGNCLQFCVTLTISDSKSPIAFTEAESK